MDRTAQHALVQLCAMRDQVRSGHERADHIQADIACYASQIVSELTDPVERGEFVTRVIWQYPTASQEIADVLGLPVFVVRVLVGKS